jgi:hypothetical protein
MLYNRELGVTTNKYYRRHKWIEGGAAKKDPSIQLAEITFYSQVSGVTSKI